MDTIPSYRIGRISEEYSLLAFMSDRNANNLTEILDSIEVKFPGSIYGLKKGQLHVTITAVIRDITFGDDTRQRFLKNEHSIIEKIGEIVQNYSPFSLHFNQIEATQDALIVKSPDDTTLNKLRMDVIEHLNIPYEPATIAHSSIARFKSEVSLNEMQEKLKNLTINFTETITELVLVRETVMPLENYEIIALFQLDNQQKSSKLVH